MAKQRTAETAVRCRGLTKTFGDVHALTDLDLEISAGTVFGFLGRNGAGKTTTIRLFTGLARPTAGAAWVNGVEMTQANSGARRGFGYLPQEPAFYNWMTPVEFLDYTARLFAMDEGARRNRIAAMLDLVGLEEARHRRIGGFSGGMKQRLSIAQALIHRPPVLFLDEPTSALDPAGRYDVLELIGRLRGRVTVFLSSHILGDVERVCDTIGVIRRGRLLLVEEREALLAQYATNVLALTIAQESISQAPAFVAALEAQPWVAGVTQENALLRVTVTDTAVSRRALWPLAAAHDLALDRYEWIRPSLEEVFLQLSR